MIIPLPPVKVGNHSDWARRVVQSLGGLSQAVSKPLSSVAADLPAFADNSAATAGGLVPGALYRTSTGVLMVVF